MRYFILVFILISCSENKKSTSLQPIASHQNVSEISIVDSIQICNYNTMEETVSNSLLHLDELYYILHNDYQKIYAFNLNTRECSLKHDYSLLPPKGFDRHLTLSIDRQGKLFPFNTMLNSIIEISEDGKSCSYKNYSSNKSPCSPSNMSHNVGFLMTYNSFIGIASCQTEQKSPEFKKQSYNLIVCGLDDNACNYFINYPEFYQSNILSINALTELSMDHDRDTIYLTYPCLPRVYRFHYQDKQIKFLDYKEFSSTLVNNSYQGMSENLGGFEDFIHNSAQGSFGPIFKTASGKICVFASKSVIDEQLDLSMIDKVALLVNNLKRTVLILDGNEIVEYHLPKSLINYSFVYKDQLYFQVPANKEWHFNYHAIKI